jgi:asparagine synthetase B (glutamine-hydrolysing)
MCGIVGILDSRGCINERQLKEMADAIVHRGPDDEGYLLIIYMFFFRTDF